MHLDSSTSTLGNGIWDGGPRRVDHRHEANEAKIRSGKVDLIGVKGKAIWELVIWEVELAETCKVGTKRHSPKGS